MNTILVKPTPAHLSGGVVASAGVWHLELDQLPLLNTGHSLAVSTISSELIKLLPNLELNLGALEAGERLYNYNDDDDESYVITDCGKRII